MAKRIYLLAASFFGCFSFFGKLVFFKLTLAGCDFFPLFPPDLNPLPPSKPNQPPKAKF